MITPKIDTLNVQLFIITFSYLKCFVTLFGVAQTARALRGDVLIESSQHSSLTMIRVTERPTLISRGAASGGQRNSTL